MPESQNTEYKESWRDEYLKWICGFANAQGGTLYIDIDDAGNVVGVDNAKKREAVYNALVHNDYASGIPIQIRIHDDEMYISNECLLPEGWTAETLMQSHRSVPRNPAIAGVFFRAGYIESWGRGIKLICDSCKELGTPDPEYTVLGRGITVKFTALESALVDDSKVPKDQPEFLNRHDVGMDVGLEDGLAERVMGIIADNPDVTAAVIAKTLYVTSRTVEREIRKLREEGRIVRVGGKRYGHWEIRG